MGGGATTRPDVLFLDVGDTLIRAHPSWAGVYRQGLLESGIDVAEKDLERALLQETVAGGWWLDEKPFEPSEAKSFDTVTAFDAAVLARLGHPNLGDETFRRIEDAFARRSACYDFPDVMPALDAMTAAGIRLCVISNFVWGAPELIHDLELAQHFEKLVISARVGFQKPNPGIFQHALEQMNVAPERAMHVGDSYRADVLGARRLGIRAALIARGPNDPARLRDEHSDPDLVVLSDLNDLLDAFGIERPVASPA
jgi:HAD superfamily hydrolase (TIGR01549 family)